MVFVFVFGATGVYAENKPTAENKNTLAESTTVEQNKAKEKIKSMGMILYKHQMVQKAVFAFAQLNNIQKRLDTTIGKMRGIDQNVVALKVQAIKDASSLARIKVDALKEAVALAYDTDKKANTANTRALKKEAEDAVKNVRNLLEDLISTLKTYK